MIKGKAARQQDYQTPEALAWALAERWAGRARAAHPKPFDLDTAAYDDGSNSHGVRWYGPTKNGLQQPWDARAVWCNPPFEDIEPWVLKAEWEVVEGRAGVVVLLLPVRASTPWWQLVQGRRWTIDYILGRVAFTDPATGKPAKGNPEATCACVCRLPLMAKDCR